MTILQITPFFHPNVGGVETHLLDLVKALKEKYYVKVLTYQALVGDKKGKKYEKSKNLEITRIPWFSNFFYKTEPYPLIHFLYLTPYLAIKSLQEVLKNKNIDIVHAHGINAAYCGLLLKVIFNKPYVVSMHVDFNLKKGNSLSNFILYPLKSADKVLVLTKTSRNQLIALGIEEKKIDTYSYWVDQNIFKPLDKTGSKKKVGIGKSAFVALFVGRISEQKGIRILMEASKKLKKATFLIAGIGEMEEEIKKHASLFKNVSYLGRVDNADLPLYYNAADILLVPSRVVTPRPTFEEGVPRVIIESISCGTPILGTDSGGTKDVIENGGVGQIVDWNTKSFVEKIKYYNKNHKELKKLSETTRRFALSVFSQKNVGVFEKTYEDLIKANFDDLLKSTADMALKRRARWILGNIDLKNREKVLDIGCGDGYYLNLLSKLNLSLNLTGTDFDKKALLSAKKNLADKNIKLFYGDLMSQLPFKEGYFDKVIMSEVTEHLPNDVKGLKEVRRVMKKDATLLLTVPSSKYPFLWDPLNWVLDRFFKTHIKSGFFAGIWNQHERLYTREEIAKVAEKSGFAVSEAKYQTWWCLPFNHYIINIGARILAKGGGDIGIIKGGSKFKKEEERGILTSIYYSFAGFVDKINDIFPIKDKGVATVVHATK